jgi:hypothetical protein
MAGAAREDAGAHALAEVDVLVERGRVRAAAKEHRAVAEPAPTHAAAATVRAMCGARVGAWPRAHMSG